ncbi:HlyD family efflux transporter periplasmic adaptor subunit [Salinisphaera hydrothermalis]|uniref:HlyD family secretion protein n=1 Tax=Salinisphaera hydrothermalis (strain C41B8) TaxID=1304275 RepID=A0A084IN46_SALHC|nr:HlyD family efflux transporter periplasmic adaptor subunit [Salinisphaera hydrothermalis]KEZ78130.1 HlyD family secretion protein [Salinisphaera hydrothermalis C41B8]
MADNDNASSKDSSQRKSGRRKWYLLGLAAIFIVAGAAYAVYYFTVAQFYAQTDDAYVKGNRIELTPQISGTVTSIAADDTDLVHAGDIVVRLDPTDARNSLDAAEARLAETVRSVHQLYAQVAEQQAIIDQRQSTLAQAKRDYERDRRLVRANGVTRQAFERSRATYHEDRAALSAARHKLTELKAQTDGTTVRDHPRVKQAESALRNAYLNLQRTKIPAPVTGHIAQREVQVGERVDPSKPMLSIVPSNQVWVDANFKETDLASMRIGQPVTVTSDFYGSNVTYHGHVAGISAGTGSAFELLPPQNATGNWIKIVRRVPVRIVLDNQHHALDKYPLRLGLSMSVTVNLHNTSGPRLSREAPKEPRYRTEVYQHRLAGANQLIRRIVEANDGSTSNSAAGTSHTKGS